MLDNSDILKVVAVLYSLYCLFNVQVCLPKVKIPISMEKYEYFKDLADHALQTGQFDIYYCFKKMVSLKAFDFVVKESIVSFTFLSHLSTSTNIILCSISIND